MPCATAAPAARVRMLGISKRGDTYLRTLLDPRRPLRTHHEQIAFRNGPSCLAERRPDAERGRRTHWQQDRTARSGFFLLAHDRIRDAAQNFRQPARLAEEVAAEITYHQERACHAEEVATRYDEVVMANIVRSQRSGQA